MEFINKHSHIKPGVKRKEYTLTVQGQRFFDNYNKLLNKDSKRIRKELIIKYHQLIR